MKTKVLAVLMCAAAAGCSPLTYFDHNFRERLEAANVPLDDIQYYVRTPIVLRRNLTASKQDITAGNVRENLQTTRQTIVFGDRSHVKPLAGVCKEWNNGALGIYFEGGDTTRRFPFQLQNDGRYMLDAYDDVLPYDGGLYNIVEGNGAFLYVSKKTLTRYKTEKRRVKGLKVK